MLVKSGALFDELVDLAATFNRATGHFLRNQSLR